MHEQLSDAERQVIGKAAAWLSRVLHDECHTQSNKTRLERLYMGGDLELAGFMCQVRQAYSAVIHRWASLRRPAAYYFQVLVSLLNEPVIGGELPY